MLAGQAQVHGGGVDPQGERASGPGWAQPELLATHPEVAAGRHDAVNFDCIDGQRLGAGFGRLIGYRGTGCRDRVRGRCCEVMSSSSIDSGPSGLSAPGPVGASSGGRHSPSTARCGSGTKVNRSAGVAMSRAWCGRRVLYSARQASTAACAASRLSKGPCGSSSSSWMLRCQRSTLPLSRGYPANPGWWLVVGSGL